MKTKVIINPQYSHLEGFVRSLPLTFDNQGEIIQDSRNTIKKISIGDSLLNVKRYHKPILINRIIYSFFRKTKAYRAYYNALAIIAKGFDTPAPISFTEEYSGGLLALSYFVSTQITGVKEIREYYHQKVEGNEAFFTAFAQYSARLHEAGILHLDYSPGNILINEDENGYHFTLIDINRMKFEKVDIRKGCGNFSRMFEHDETYIYLAKEYAKIRHADENECIKLILHYKQKFHEGRKRKERLKKLFRKN